MRRSWGRSFRLLDRRLPICGSRRSAAEAIGSPPKGAPKRVPSIRPIATTHCRWIVGSKSLRQRSRISLSSGRPWSAGSDSKTPTIRDTSSSCTTRKATSSASVEPEPEGSCMQRSEIQCTVPRHSGRPTKCTGSAALRRTDDSCDAESSTASEATDTA